MPPRIHWCLMTGAGFFSSSGSTTQKSSSWSSSWWWWTGTKDIKELTNQQEHKTQQNWELTNRRPGTHTHKHTHDTHDRYSTWTNNQDYTQLTTNKNKRHQRPDQSKATQTNQRTRTPNTINTDSQSNRNLNKTQQNWPININIEQPTQNNNVEKSTADNQQNNSLHLERNHSYLPFSTRISCENWPLGIYCSEKLPPLFILGRRDYWCHICMPREPFNNDRSQVHIYVPFGIQLHQNGSSFGQVFTHDEFLRQMWILSFIRTNGK